MVPAVCAKDIRVLIRLASRFSDVCVFVQMHIFIQRLFRERRAARVSPVSYIFVFFFLNIALV